MAGAPAAPENLQVQSANQEILVSWSLSTGATSYTVQRSLDNVTFTDLALVDGSPLATSYLDQDVELGTEYFYQVKSTNSDGSSPYTLPLSAVPVPTGEMCLSQIILASKQRADRVESQFVTDSEWRAYINQASFELYDLLTTVYEDYNVATPIAFTADGTTYRYALPNGSNSFANADTGVAFIPQAFYKLLGVDLALNNAPNAYVTINKFNFIDRNKYLYPNSNSTIYGTFNMQYRVMGSNIELIPTPSAGQQIRLWYIPRLAELLRPTDITTIGISGWLEYVIVRAAKYALDKEESDSSKLDQEILFMKGRIEESASNRDAGQPDCIADTRSMNGGFGSGTGSGFGRGGF